MADWFSYSPSDFVMFSADVYWRLFALQNLSLWPLPVIAAMLGLLILGALAVPGRWSEPAIWTILSLAWVGSAYFIAVRYAPINLPMTYVVWVFGAQAAGLVVAMATRAIGSPKLTPGLSQGLGGALVIYAALFYPWSGVILGRPLDQAEIFGLAPDPTALASLGLLLMTERRLWGRVLSIVPAVWCVVSATTLLTLGDMQGWVLLGALGFWVIGCLVAIRSGGGPQTK